MARLTRQQRVFSDVHYRDIVANSTEANRRRAESLANRARSRQYFDEAMARKRKHVADHATPPAKTVCTRGRDDRAELPTLGLIGPGEPRIHVLLRALEHVLKPETRTEALGDWLQLAMRWEFAPTAAELLKASSP